MAFKPWLFDVSTGNEKIGQIDLSSASMVVNLLAATNIATDATTIDGTGSTLSVKNLGITAAKLSVGAGTDWQRLVYDSSTSSLAWYTNTSIVQPCRVTVSTNINTANPGTAVFDGVTLGTNDRVLLTGQTTASQNGVWLFATSSTAMTRAIDANAGTRLTSGTLIGVWAGTANANSIWMLSNDTAITIGATSLVFTRLNPTGGSGTVTSVSVTTANGVSGTVATSTTTPAITLTLGAITPTSVTMGGTAQTYNSLTPTIQTLGITQSASSNLLAQYSNNALSANLQFFKSRGASVGTHTALSSGDVLGKIDFLGVASTTTNRPSIAYVQGVADGSPLAAFIPGRIEWYTSSGFAVPALRMTLDSSGNLTMNGSGSITAAGGTVTASFGTFTNGTVQASEFQIFNFSSTAVGNIQGQSNLFGIASAGASGFSMLFNNAAFGSTHWVTTFGGASGDQLFTMQGSTFNPYTMWIGVGGYQNSSLAVVNMAGGSGNTSLQGMASLIITRSNGSSFGGTNTALSSGDIIGALSWNGSNSQTTLGEGARIEAVANGTWSGTSQPTKIDFYVTGILSTIPAVGMTVTSSRDLSVTRSIFTTNGSVSSGGSSGINAAQGAYMGWNLNSTGETDFLNNQGSGTGGWTFINSTSGFTTTTVASLSAIGELGLLTLPATTTPTTPTAGYGRLYSRYIAGRSMLGLTDESGQTSVLQPHFGRNNVETWDAIAQNTAGTIALNLALQTYGVTAPNVVSNSAVTVLGSLTASTNFFTRRVKFGLQTASTANSVGYLFSNQLTVTLGTGSGDGGFHFIGRFSLGSTGTGERAFVGMTTSAVAPTNVDPGTLTNCVGVAKISTDATQLYIVYGGSSAQTKIALGTSFPANTSQTDVYELALFAPQNANNIVYYEVTRLNTGAVTSGTLTGTAGTALPASTALMGPRIWITNNATASQSTIYFLSMYLETNN